MTSFAGVTDLNLYTVGTFSVHLTAFYYFISDHWPTIINSLKVEGMLRGAIKSLD